MKIHPIQAIILIITIVLISRTMADIEVFGKCKTNGEYMTPFKQSIKCEVVE